MSIALRVPTHKLRRANSASTGSVPVIQISKTPFWKISGTINGKAMEFLLDTGSSDFWVHGSKAPDPDGGPGATLIPGESFNIHYQVNAGGTTGSVVRTSTEFGGIIVPDYGVGVAKSSGLNFPLDGFIGLGFKAQNSVRPHQQPTFMEAAQKYLSAPVFSLNLKTDGSGSLDFGKIDSSKYTGDLIKGQVSNQTDATWTVDQVTLSVNGGKVEKTQAFLFDSGSGDPMEADPAFVDGYYKQIPTAEKTSNGWVFSCKAKMPNIAISFGGASASIPGTNLLAGPIAGHSSICTGKIVGRPGKGDIGSPFFTSMFVVFNQAEPSISFARQGADVASVSVS